MATFAKPGNTSVSAEEVKSDMDGPLPPKRMPEVTSAERDDIQEVGNDLTKRQKLEIPSADESDHLLPDVEDGKGVSEAENSGIQLNKAVEDEDEDEEDEDEEDYEDDSEDEVEDSEEEDDDDDTDEQSNGVPKVIDPKGKGILKDEKGKGKLIEESEDSSDSGDESDGKSDLCDDPLTEVDLNNILPSRTRRRAVKPGINISNNHGSKDAD